MPAILAVLLALLILAAPAAARPGDRDRGFGVRGTALAQTSSSGAVGAALRADGRAVVAGGFGIEQFSRTGRHDTGFGAGGPTTDAELREILQGPVLDSAGRAYLVERTYITATNRYVLALVRLLPSGALDPAFGDKGRRAVPPLSAESTSITDLERDARGRLWLAGGIGRGSGRRGYVARFGPDGTPDPAFGKAGIATFASATATTQLLIRRGAPVIAAETVRRRPPRTPASMQLRALRDTGATDRSFGRAGLATGRAGGHQLLAASSIARGPRGSVLVAGPARRAGTRTTRPWTFVARFLSRGRPDRRFGSGGLARLPAGGSSYPAVASDRRGRVVVAGTPPDGPAEDVAVQRLRANGRTDRRFGRRGITRFRPASRPGITIIAAEVAGVLIRGNGRIVVAGTGWDDDVEFRDDLGQPHLALTQLLG